MSRILGISGSAADAAACLLVDGEIVGAIEEERITRVKHIGGFPTRSIKWLAGRMGEPSRARLTAEFMKGVDAIGFHCDPRLHMTRRLPRYARNIGRAPADSLFSMIDEIRKFASLKRNQIDVPFEGKKVHLIEHHMNHAASVYHFYGWDDAAILTMDYIGESTSTLLAHGQGNRIKKLAEIPFPHSLGALYSYITQWLGFQPHSDEYKVMGLAPYGRPRYVDQFRKFIVLGKNGTYRIDLSRFDWWFRRYGTENTAFGKAFGERRRNGEITEHHEDVAFAMQKLLEETVLHIATHLRSRTGSERLGLAGGVALNSVANGVLERSGLFKEVEACPASHDGGLAIGAALHVHHAIRGETSGRRPIGHVYWGPSYDDEAIDEFLKESKIEARRISDPAGEAAKAIEAGKVVGWFQGSEEFGPRALGSRSILADPRRAEMKDIVNRCIKFREPFRPFAPSCLAEESHNWFEVPAGRHLPYMLFVHPVRPAMRQKIPAVTHVDGTARIQTVSRESNPLYHDLISAFFRKTGVPIVLNTSFNVKGEPIVSTPADAVRCFYSTGLDLLFIGKRVLAK